MIETIKIQTIKIEGKPNQRILVLFDPEKESITFIGQVRVRNIEWVDFGEESHSMNIDLEKIQDLLFATYEKMKKRVEAYNNIAEGFEKIKTIEIAGEDIPEENGVETSNDVYGTLVENDF